MLGRATVYLKGQCHAIWQLYKNLEGVFASFDDSKTNGDTAPRTARICTGRL